jgi:hypothetical protein
MKFVNPHKKSIIIRIPRLGVFLHSLKKKQDIHADYKIYEIYYTLQSGGDPIFKLVPIEACNLQVKKRNEES